MKFKEASMPRPKKARKARKAAPDVLQHGSCFNGNLDLLVGERAFCICGAILRPTAVSQIYWTKLLVFVKKGVKKGKEGGNWERKPWPAVECPECGLDAYIKPPPSMINIE